MIRKETKREVENFISKYCKSKSIMKINLDAMKESIKFFEQNGEEAYRKEYPFSTYNLDELKYYKKQCAKALRAL